mgnify:FL=1
MNKKIPPKIPKDRYLRIKVIPKAEKTCISEIIEDEDGQTIKIRIKAPPEGGKANKELLKFLSKEFSLPKQNIEIISGKTSQLKLLKITWNVTDKLEYYKKPAE